MRAVIFEKYDVDNGMRFGEMAKPELKGDQVLVRVVAASVNSWDWELLSGRFLARMGSPFRPPHRVLGADVAGVVEAAGPEARRFKPGDAVIGELSGQGWGGFAEFVAASETVFTAKPAALSFEDAATLPQAGGLALQAVRAHEALGPRQTVLVNGGGGGMGGFAIQLAKARHAHVTAVDLGAKFTFMRLMGADFVIDYTRQDIGRRGEHYDLVIDPVARRSYFTHLRLLKPGGTLMMVGGRAGTLLQSGLLGAALHPMTGKKIGPLIWRPRIEDTEQLAAMFAKGALRSIIGRIFPLERTAEAIQLVGAGEIAGKAVIRVSG